MILHNDPHVNTSHHTKHVPKWESFQINYMIKTNDEYEEITTTQSHVIIPHVIMYPVYIYTNKRMIRRKKEMKED